MGKEEMRILTLDPYEHGVVINALNDMRKALDLNPKLLEKLNGEFKTTEKGHC